MPTHGVSGGEPAGANPSAAGADSQFNDLLPTVYEELRRRAAAYLRGERPGHTLQPTALVHETYIRLAQQEHIDERDRGSIVALGAHIMRQILINHAKSRSRLKRGGPEAVRITLDEALDFYDRRDISIAAVDEALLELEKIDPRQAQIVELRFFGGLTVDEIAEGLNISPATVKRDWTVAKIWLHRELSS
jgi:RNA polymerase sigma factor (TIGR02999 family)